MNDTFDGGYAVLVFIVVTVPVLLIYGYALIDVVRRQQLSVIKKAGWGAGILLIPALGVLTYFVMRPTAPPPGKTETTRTTGVADAAEALRAGWESGELTDAAYLEAKRQLFRA